MNGFEVREVRKYVLVNEETGQPVINERGDVWYYDSVEHAESVAENWERYRMPTYEELQAMSDDQLHTRAGLLSRFRR